MIDLSDSAELKRIARISARERTKAHTSAELAKESRLAVDMLADVLPKRGNILLYWRLPDEPDIGDLFHIIWERGGTTLLPRCRTDGSLDAVLYDDSSVLEKGRLNVTYPVSGDIVLPPDIDAAVIPALAYDRSGVRLGRGGGYYDRFLPDLGKDTETIGLCFSWNLLDKLPREPHDVLAKRVICPRVGR